MSTLQALENVHDRISNALIHCEKASDWSHGDAYLEDHLLKAIHDLQEATLALSAILGKGGAGERIDADRFDTISYIR